MQVVSHTRPGRRDTSGIRDSPPRRLGIGRQWKYLEPSRRCSDKGVSPESRSSCNWHSDVQTGLMSQRSAVQQRSTAMVPTPNTYEVVPSRLDKRQSTLVGAHAAPLQAEDRANGGCHRWSQMPDPTANAGRSRRTFRDARLQDGRLWTGSHDSSRPKK